MLNCSEQQENLCICLLQETLPTSTTPVLADAQVGSAADQGKPSSLTAHMPAAPQHLQQTRLLADFHQWFNNR